MYHARKIDSLELNGIPLFYNKGHFRLFHPIPALIHTHHPPPRRKLNSISKPASLFCGLPPVAISTTHNCQCYFYFQSWYGCTFRDQPTNGCGLTSYMVKLKNIGISFAAIPAWMGYEIVIYEVMGCLPRPNFPLPGALFFFCYMALVIPALESVLTITA